MGLTLSGSGSAGGKHWSSLSRLDIVPAKLAAREFGHVARNVASRLWALRLKPSIQWPSFAMLTGPFTCTAAIDICRVNG